MSKDKGLGLKNYRFLNAIMETTSDPELINHVARIQKFPFSASQYNALNNQPLEYA